MRLAPGAVLLAACGGTTSGADITISGAVGANNQLHSAAFYELDSGHVPSNFGLAVSELEFWTDTAKTQVFASLTIDFHEPPAVRDFTLVSKDRVDLLDGEATVVYEEVVGGFRWRSTGGTLKMMEASGATLAVKMSAVPMDTYTDVITNNATGNFVATASATATAYEASPP